MGLMPAGSGNPFRKLDEQSVVGMFKAIGARDPDVLHAQKEKLLAQPKQLKLLGIICVVVGVFLTITVVAAIAGIPSIIFGWWTWRFGQRNVAAIEAGLTRYTQSVAT
jgi:hypothetical protein